MEFKKISFKELFNFIVYAFVAILAFTLLSMLATTFTNGYGYLEFCIRSECLLNFYDYHKGSFDFFTKSISVISSIVTAVGIFVAVLTFINTKDSNALNNHISHLKLFTDYVESEVGNRDCLKISSFDSLSWYNLMFKESFAGSMIVSDEYLNKIYDINEQIRVTNEKSTKASNGPFRYTEHQARIIKVLKPLGIKLESSPKNDFMIIEQQVFSLIDVINGTFCHKENISKMLKVKYYG